MGHDGLTGRSERKRRHYNKHKDNGVCYHCSDDVVPGRRRCQKHLDLKKKYEKISRQRKLIKV